MAERPKITPEQIRNYTTEVTDIYISIEEELFLAIAKRLKTNPEYNKDQVLRWQVEKMQQLRMLNEDTIRELSKVTGLSADAIRQAIRDAGYDTLDAVDGEVKQAHGELIEKDDDFLLNAFVVLASMGSKFTPLSKEKYDGRLNGFINQAFRNINVNINETLITTNYGEGSVARMYRNIVNEVVSKVLGGEMTINKAVAETVTKWSDKGIDTGFVDKGGNVWTLERYAESVIRSTVNDTYNDFTIERMGEYGTDLVLVSSLSDPREACSLIQGKVASLSDPSSNPKYPSIYEFGYGTPSGCRGINCRHKFFVWFEGISINNQPQWSREEMDKNYKLSQKQRYYERQIRKAKQSLNLSKEIGDPDTIQRYQKLVSARQARIREFIQENKLSRRYDKEKIY